MLIRRLGWAGIEVIVDGSSLVVDYVRDFPLLTATQPHGAYAPHTRRAVAALVTHLHEDHTDVAAIESAVGPAGVVLRPAPLVGVDDDVAFTERGEELLETSSLDVRVAVEWQSVSLGPFTVTAVPAVDGLGDPQVNWVIDAGGQRILHGGDTMFHGYWWLIARRLGPIDIAVLPVNGAKANAPHLHPPSELPAVLTPDQAARAAVILGAHTVLPIHYGVHQPPIYVEHPDPLGRLVELAEELPFTVLAPEMGVEVSGSR